MAVDKLNPQSVALFFGQYQRQINLVVVVVLAIYLLAFLAELVWRIIPEPQSTAQRAQQTNVGSAPVRNQNAQSNISALQRLNLFGEVDAQQPVEQQEEVTDAPETSLSLVLTGVVSSSNVDFGAAIIEHRGAQNTYGIGEKIDGTNATLHQVQEDRVIIKNGARNETLMLEGIDYEESNQQRTVQQQQRVQQIETANTRNELNRQPPEGPVRLSDEAVAATQQLRSAPDSFTDFISVAPFRRDNAIAGYRVVPGKNPALFEAAGLKPGDIITEINGLDVTEPQQSLQAMGELRSASYIELSVNRAGELLTLYLELPEDTDA